MSSTHDLYLRLPPVLQNLALDAIGIRERRIRFSGEYEAARRGALARRLLSREDLERYALGRVNAVLLQARTVTAFYPRFWASNVPAVLTDLADLRRFPILDKRTARASNDGLRASSTQAPLVLQTTGTTGSPIRVFSSVGARQRNYAFFDDFLLARGIEPRSRRVVFGGRVVISGDAGPPFWRRSRTLNTIYLSSYHLSPANAASYAAALTQLAPAYIEAYPSAIAELAHLFLQSGIRLGRSIPVVTSAETLREEQEILIRKVFGGEVFDQYGAAEMCVFAERCERGNYHVRNDYGFVEVLTEDGRAALPGETGRVICTGLINDGMPLVRYEIGDSVEVGGPECPCGWDSPIWTKVLGRLDDVVRTRSGRAIGRLSPVLKGFPISAAQYVQNSLDELRVLVIPEEGFTDSTISLIQRAVRQRVGEELHVRVEIVTEIPRGAGGKRRAVVSTIGREGAST